MKQLNIFHTTAHNRIAIFFAVITVFFMSNPVLANGLTNAKTALETLQADLKKIVPIAAALILLFLAIGYAGRYIEKETFIRWGIGVVVAGSAAELASLLLKNS
ncbi:VirB2 family type IV secretion system major pilin TrwL [Bartonella tribocorum]|uniref:Conjugal transfer protein n=1 Tax=Bartonella tribocorum TaxID=85701 RepID=A0A2M6UW73_9HYPH|nr:VirB2 family type IV secretion system major pilin TrwL [Bartonella tribocorum]PIT70411.1 conjugal transfer protein [Bartonella tribocorum]